MASLDWRAQLEAPDGAFFQAFAARLRDENGLRDAVREAVKTLCFRVDWDAYLPQPPHGLLGLRAAFRLRPYLEAGSFQRIVATQIHAFAHEGRRLKPLAPVQGAGSWKNLEHFIAAGRPALARMEAHSFAQPSAADFARLGARVAPDMAVVGHKAVMAHHLGELHEWLDQPKATGRHLFAMSAWMAATPPDTFWNRRARTRLSGDLALPEGPPGWDAGMRRETAREICDLGLVELLNRFVARIRSAPSRADLLAALAQAAAEKQLDARRDLEGKTGWNFVYLATHALRQGGDAHCFAQAAALINLFPTGEPEHRIQPRAPSGAVTAQALTDAILDAEPALALGTALALAEQHGAASLLTPLAEAASANDPAFNHAHHTMMVAAGADLLPLLPEVVATDMLAAMAKSLANHQGSADLGRKASEAMGGLTGNGDAAAKLHE